MTPFTLTRVSELTAATGLLSQGQRALAGGTTLVDLMREGVETPAALLDITALPLTGVEVRDDGAVRIGALVTMAQAAAEPRLRAALPVVTQALELSASAQLRNMATIGGNLMQRTRCTYFRDVSAPCNKREPGSGCSAIGGHHRNHAILGGSPACIATHPSDLAVALVALGASLELAGPAGTRVVPLAEFLLVPGSTPEREHDLAPGELITAVQLPATPPLHSGYLKVRDRSSYEFALCSAAVALRVTGGVIERAHVAAGGVGTVPWRLDRVEAALVGQRPSAGLWQSAAALASDGASPLSENTFKVELLRRTVARQLRTIGAAA